jgi:hypothetical protein
MTVLQCQALLILVCHPTGSFVHPVLTRRPAFTEIQNHLLVRLQVEMSFEYAHILTVRLWGASRKFLFIYDGQYEAPYPRRFGVDIKSILTLQYKAIFLSYLPCGSFVLCSRAGRW